MSKEKEVPASNTIDTEEVIRLLMRLIARWLDQQAEAEEVRSNGGG